MPIEGTLKRGDCVRVDGNVFYVRTSGTCIYLHPTVDSCRRASGHTRTIRKYRLVRDGDRVPPQVAPVPRRRRVTEADIRYLYVVRNCDLPREERDLKIGITSNVPTTLRTYRRLQPNSQAITIVDCQGAARPLEQRLHARFDDFRVDESEVFLLRPHEVRRRLMQYGYQQAADGIWRM